MASADVARAGKQDRRCGGEPQLCQLLCNVSRCFEHLCCHLLICSMGTMGVPPRVVPRIKESPDVKPWHGAAPLRADGDLTCHLGTVHRKVEMRERLETRDLVHRVFVVWPAVPSEILPLGR